MQWLRWLAAWRGVEVRAQVHPSAPICVGIGCRHSAHCHQRHAVRQHCPEGLNALWGHCRAGEEREGSGARRQGGKGIRGHAHARHSQQPHSARRAHHCAVCIGRPAPAPRQQQPQQQRLRGTAQCPRPAPRGGGARLQQAQQWRRRPLGSSGAPQSRAHPCSSQGRSPLQLPCGGCCPAEWAMSGAAARAARQRARRRT